MADFGMDAAAFFFAPGRISGTVPAHSLRPDLLERMKAVARRRLWLATRHALQIRSARSNYLSW
jgi:hypothetical protein